MNTEKTILVVEDNPDDEILTIRALKKANITNNIVVARDGQEALTLLLSGSAPIRPSVILLDLKLPKVNGLEVLRTLKLNDQTKNIPVVVLTSSNQEKDIVDAYHYSANSYVRKTVDVELYTSRISTVGTYWITINEEYPQRAS